MPTTTVPPADDVKADSWLLLMHQIPPKPGYLRVKIWRRLQALGAVAIKNSVYALPNTDDAREDFEWTLREIVKEGGEATLCEAHFIEGLTDQEVQRLFHAARDADYAEIGEAARSSPPSFPGVQSRKTAGLNWRPKSPGSGVASPRSVASTSLLHQGAKRRRGE